MSSLRRNKSKQVSTGKLCELSFKRKGKGTPHAHSVLVGDRLPVEGLADLGRVDRVGLGLGVARLAVLGVREYGLDVLGGVLKVQVEQRLVRRVGCSHGE